VKRASSLLALLVVVSLVAPTGAAALEQRNAVLSIDQPHYIESDVQESAVNGSTVYEAEGPSLEIRPRNFAPGDVRSFGVEESAGSLSYDSSMGVYVFETDRDGTYNLYWTVNETRVVNETRGNETVETRESVRVQYSASLRVESSERTHIPASQLEGVREDAANWSEFTSAVRSEEVAGPNANMEEESQLAVNLLRLRYHPLSALTGNFTQVLLTLFITLGGFFVLLLFATYHYLTRRSDIKFRHRRESLDAERADVEDQLLELDERERLAALEGMDWNDIFPDDVARAFRESFGENVLEGFLRIQESFKPSNLVRDRLEAMDSEGYVAVVDREDVATDGGADVESRIVDARIVSDTNLEPGDEPVDLSEPSEDLLDALAWDDPELRSFDLPSHDLDQSEFSTRLEGATLEELIEEYEVDMRQFDGNKEVFAEYLLEFLTSVEGHEYTDEDGRVRHLRHVLNLFLRVSRLLDEKHETPLAAYQSEHIAYLLANYERDEEISQYVDEVREGRYA